MKAWQGSLGVVQTDRLVSPAYFVFDFKMPNLAFGEALLRSRPYVAELARGSDGVRIGQWDLSSDALKRIPTLLPPPDEQSAIVRFLNDFTRASRRYLASGRKLIGLLEEQKPAIVDLAVRRGLDSGVHLAPSGIDWLGDIPAHWRVARLRNLTSRITSGSRGWSGYAADSGPLFIRIGNLTRSSVDLDFEDVVRLDLPREAATEAARTRVAHGDVLISITAFIGSVAVVPSCVEEAYVSQHVASARLAPGAANPRWVAYVLLSSVGQTHGVHSMYGGTKQGLSLDDVKNYPVLLPPLAEQDDLVRRIDALLAPIDSAIAAVRKQIWLATELRTRLIADVVTGKLDVRSAAVGPSDLGGGFADAGCDDLETENGEPSDEDREGEPPGEDG